jgi:calcium uniporter protein, mitochondrial
MRRRLRRITTELDALSAIKRECDALAHKSAQRIAVSGFLVLLGWWICVFRYTFLTDLGWDVMEPVTYLVGLTTVISGYLWFLYHNREVSYRSMLNITITRRQAKLYDEKGFDVERWEELVQEGKELRSEIRRVAKEYDVDWKEGKKEAVNKELWDEEEREKSNTKKIEEDMAKEEDERR